MMFNPNTKHDEEPKVKWPAHGLTDVTAQRTPHRKHSKDCVEDKLNPGWSKGG